MCYKVKRERGEEHLTIEISLHSFKYSSKTGTIFNFIDNYSDLQIPHLKTFWLSFGNWHNFDRFFDPKMTKIALR